MIKVQQGYEENLSNYKAKAIAPWKLDPESGEDTLDKLIAEFKMIKQDQENANKRKSAVESPKSAYDPAIKECVGGSAAEAERVWSMAGHVLTDHCLSMSPLIFELIMYLKYNSCLWGIADVVEAKKRRKSESVAAQFCLSIQKERLDKKKAELYLWDEVMHALNDIDIENMTRGDMEESSDDEGMEAVA